MPGGRFAKTAAPYFSLGKYLNGNNANGDSVIGGTLTAIPSGLTISQFEQNLPGDRFIFSAADAFAASNNNQILYTGTYGYVSSRNNSTSIPQRGRACFWDLITSPGNFTASNYQADQIYQVNSDEPANIGVSMFAGVYINNMVAGNYWFIQVAGKASCWFRGNNGNTLYGGAALTGTAAIGQGVYLAAVGNNNNLNTGLFDVFSGANSAAIFTANSTTAYNTIDQMMTRYVGPAETLPSNGNISLVDIVLSRVGWRW
jgi:hypothetical protein